VLEWIEATSFGVWMRESPSIWSFPTVLTLHTAGLAMLVGGSWLLDLRLLGMNRNVPLSGYRWVFPVVSIGLLVNVVTGVMLFIKNATVLGTALPFLIKMALVIVSAATLVPMRSLVLRSGPEQRDVGSNARLLAIASIVGWTSAMTAGRLLAYLVV
jgi:hypothetical protein